MKKRWLVLLAATKLLALNACSSTREQTFRDIPGNSIVFPQKAEAVKSAVIVTLAQKGFQTESNSNGNFIKAKKYAKDGNTTCVTTLDCYLIDLGNDTTKLQVAAVEETSKTSGHVKYFWLLFIPIPIGSYDTAAVTGVETIYDKKFYSELFSTIQKNLSSDPKT